MYLSGTSRRVARRFVACIVFLSGGTNRRAARRFVARVHQSCNDSTSPDDNVTVALALLICSRAAGRARAAERSAGGGRRGAAPIAMAARAAKAHRIGALRAQLPHMTQAAYAAMLEADQIGALDGIHGTVQRAEVRRSRDEVVKTQTQYGPLHQTIPLSDGRMMEVCAPAAMLAHASGLGPIQRLLERALATSRRLHVILYADEVTPGNNLAHKHARKTWAWYWSVQEFGPAALASEDRTGLTPSPRELRGLKPTKFARVGACVGDGVGSMPSQDAWFQCASLRTTVVGEMPHGASSMFTTILELFWPPAGGHNLSTAGMLLFGELAFFDLGVFIYHRLCAPARSISRRTTTACLRMARAEAIAHSTVSPRTCTFGLA